MSRNRDPRSTCSRAAAIGKYVDEIAFRRHMPMNMSIAPT
jgi:hypothetical protein